jgi:hypothetical protein
VTEPAICGAVYPEAPGLTVGGVGSELDTACVTTGAAWTGASAGGGVAVLVGANAGRIGNGGARLIGADTFLEAAFSTGAGRGFTVGARGGATTRAGFTAAAFVVGVTISVRVGAAVIGAAGVGRMDIGAATTGLGAGTTGKGAATTGFGAGTTGAGAAAAIFGNASGMLGAGVAAIGDGACTTGAAIAAVGLGA